MKKIVVATRNPGKLREMMSAFSSLPVELVALSDFAGLPDAPETGETLLENAEEKARFYAKETGEACLADDSGLFVEALSGAPGVHSARFAGEDAGDAKNNEKLVEELTRAGCDASPAVYRCVLAFLDTDGSLITSEGKCEGTVKKEARGTGGFGYDPHFYIGDRVTMAELSLAEKGIISHRGAAIRSMTDKLKGYLMSPKMHFVKEENRIYIANDDGKLLGEITFPVHIPGLYDIDRTFVDESMRGQGIGEKLVKAATDAIMARGGRFVATCPYAAKWIRENL